MDQARLIAPAALGDLAVAGFRPRAPWWGGDLQTLGGYLRRRAPLDAYPLERLVLALADGSGDRLSAALNRPAPGAPPRPLAVLIHGLSGDEHSFYMRRTAAHLLALGYPVLRLNLRGAGPSRAMCRLSYHGGRSADLALALAAVPSALTAEGIVAIGYSLGANMLLKFLGEHGAASPVRAAVAISAPIDLAVTARRMLRWRNFLYQAYVLRDMRAQALAPIAELTQAERQAIRGARTIWDFDDRFSAPRNGFNGAVDYYERNSARHFLGAVAVPTLVIHALDDPWVPSEPYRAFAWKSNPHLVPLLPAAGGHVGFHGRDRRTPWHDLAAVRFLAAVFSAR
jgi:hypothetical protein